VTAARIDTHSGDVCHLPILTEI